MPIHHRCGSPLNAMRRVMPPSLRAALCALLCAAAVMAAVPLRAAADETGLQTIDPNQRQGSGQVVIDRGHVDFGPTLATGAWRMQLHDDTGDTSYWRNPEDVVIWLNDDAIIDMPDDDAYGFIGERPGTPLYVVPQTQNPDVAWVGWNTQEPGVMERLRGGMTLSLDGVDGPGALDVYLENGNFGAPTEVWSSRRPYPQASFIETNMHTHVNWVFHAPGVYRVRLTLSGDLTDGGHVSDSNVLTFAVGEDTDPWRAFDATARDGDSERTDAGDGASKADTHGTDARSDRGGTHGAAGAADAAGAAGAADAADDRERRDARERMLMIGVIAGAAAVAVIAVMLAVWARGRRDRAEALAEADNGSADGRRVDNGSADGDGTSRRGADGR